MTDDRRSNVNSASKTITSVAVNAAIYDLAYGLHSTQPSLGPTLDSSIFPYLPAKWQAEMATSTWLKNTTFRAVLSHTAGLCSDSGGDPNGYDFGGEYNLLKTGPLGTVGKYSYCNGGYALMRILLPYVVDGPQAYSSYDGGADALVTGSLIDHLTSMSYRNYVRNRVFDPLGIPGADLFYTGSSALETLYFDANTSNPVLAHWDNVNFQSPAAGGENQMYTAKSDDQVSWAGESYWYLSAEEYSSFISGFWLGRILPNTAGSCGQTAPGSCISQLLPGYQTSVQTSGYGLGIGATTNVTLYDGTRPFAYNHNGGEAGVSDWITFTNGYTAFFIQNMFPFKVADSLPEDMLNKAFAAAIAPASWTCSIAYFNHQDGCDCNCGAWDPDCNIQPAEPLDCSDSGAVGPPTGSHCNPATNQCAP